MRSGFQNHLEKLSLIFLYNFQCEHSLLKLVIKILSPKINVKSIKSMYIIAEKIRGDYYVC